MNKRIYGLVFLIFALLTVSCGGGGAIVSKKLSVGDSNIPDNKNIVIFQNVSRIIVDDFRAYFDNSYKNSNYYSKNHMSCNDLGFNYISVKYLEDYTYLTRYLDDNKIYYCFEVTSNGAKYKGNINSIITMDYI